MPNSDWRFYPSLLKPWSNINTRQNNLTQRWGLLPIDGNPAMGKRTHRWLGMTVVSHLRLILSMFGSQPPTQRWEACTYRWVGSRDYIYHDYGKSISHSHIMEGTSRTLPYTIRFVGLLGSHSLGRNPKFMATAVDLGRE
ncbi:hypothetical protein DM860_014047 [Cuscuta australis]|uniref:Uncharacterized protein n=1 Tax=Cuscuta australis TaxID=267555 RepID=A0A328DSY9_9ASTE|nr:hypothetical protein DM860_014047 [Cuscuta australis]